MPLNIDSITVDPGLALAPMAGITGHPFRLLAKEQGCRLLFSEMVSAKGLVYNNRRNRSLLYFTEEERPIGFQLFGSEPVILAEAAKHLEQHGADFIDLNLGCPTPKITRNGEGGALMRRPGLCSRIFEVVVKAVACPVTVKLRKGWNEQEANVLDITARAEAAGVSAVTVHGRTVDQGYSGRADWAVIAAVKQSLNIPVIGNGDIDSPEAAEAMLSSCGCDGIMIGRAARGYPWIFNAVLARLQKKPAPSSPTIDEIVNTALRHFSLLSAIIGEPAAAREMRRHFAWYIKGLPGASAARQQLIRISSFKEAESALRDFSCKVEKH